MLVKRIDSNGDAAADRRSNKCAAYEYIICVTQQAFVMIICNGQMKQTCYVNKDRNALVRMAEVTLLM